MSVLVERRKETNARGANSLGEKVVGIVGLEAEYFTGQMESADLPTPVRQKAVNPNRAELDLIEAARLFALTVNLRPGRKKVARLRFAGAEDSDGIGWSASEGCKGRADLEVV